MTPTQPYGVDRTSSRMRASLIFSFVDWSRISRATAFTLFVISFHFPIRLLGLRCDRLGKTTNAMTSDRIYTALATSTADPMCAWDNQSRNSEIRQKLFTLLTFSRWSSARPLLLVRIDHRSAETYEKSFSISERRSRPTGNMYILICILAGMFLFLAGTRFPSFLLNIHKQCTCFNNALFSFLNLKRPNGSLPSTTLFTGLWHNYYYYRIRSILEYHIFCRSTDD